MAQRPLLLYAPPGLAPPGQLAQRLLLLYALLGSGGCCPAAAARHHPWFDSRLAGEFGLGDRKRGHGYGHGVAEADRVSDRGRRGFG